MRRHVGRSSNNMKDIKVVIGANFGDEGKGLMTDYFAHHMGERVLNVRFNGGAQAGHTVETENGARHVFQSIGAASFNPGVTTYLSPYFVLNPLALIMEKSMLERQGTTTKILVDTACKVTLPCDLYLNQLIESHRGKAKHGSCGYGVWETVIRNRDYATLTLGTLMRRIDRLPNIMAAILEDYVKPKVDELHIDYNKLDDIGKEAYTNLFNTRVYEKFQGVFTSMLLQIDVVTTSVLNDYEHIVFEGAQGLGLDWDNRKYMPNITASYTGMKNVKALLADVDNYELETCYVMRSYGTRHGAGPFTTECTRDELSVPADATNTFNEFQGSFRYGRLNLGEILDNISNDKQYWIEGQRISLAITHLDETGGELLLGNDEQAERKGLNKFILDNKSTVYTSHSPTRQLIQVANRT